MGCELQTSPKETAQVVKYRRRQDFDCQFSNDENVVLKAVYTIFVYEV